MNKLALYLRMIKFSHSVFALPFAFAAAVLAEAGIPSWNKTLWIALAMLGARSGAMGLNRIIDCEIDALNPRTANRELPAGKIKKSHAWVFTIIAFSVMIFSAYMLNPLCLMLSPVAIGVFVLYSYCKRFTWLCHIVLGVAISGAPLGAWIAITGEVDARILPLCIAVVTWLAGFDILYALQDIDFDRRHGLYSIPAIFGTAKSLLLSKLLHLNTWVLLTCTGVLFNLGWVFYLTMLIIAGILIYEHSLVKENDLSKLDIAFFNMNGYISVVFFAGILISVLWK